MTGLILSLLGLWVLLGAIWLAVWPLLGDGSAFRPEAEIDLAELEAEKARLVAEIHELDLDYETGKLSDEDHREIESRLKGRTVEVMRKIESARPTAGRTSG